MLNVHLRINDSVTGEPLPVRLRISGPKGEHFAPLGRLVEFATMRGEDVGGQVLLGSERWFFLDGPCEIPLPDSLPLRVQAFHGNCYLPINEEITLKPGQMAIRLSMKRLIDWRKDWVSADCRVHHMAPHSTLVEAAAEDLDLVNLLVEARRFLSQDGNTFQSLTNMLAFSGQVPALEQNGRAVAVNTLNSHPVLGQLALLHAHRPIYPLSFGPPDEPDDWSLADWCQQCHRKNGFVVWANPLKSEGALVGGEGLTMAILGKLDALEFDGQARKVSLIPLWYRLLNCGFRIPLVGSSAKDSNRGVLGWPRTFAKVQQRKENDFANWFDGFRNSASFVTNGPMLRLDLGDYASVEVVAESVFPFDKVELVLNGKVLTSATASQQGELWQANLAQAIPANSTGWLATRIIASGTSPVAPSQQLFAHTNPVWLKEAAEPAPEESVKFLADAVKLTRNWFEEHGHFTKPVRKQQHMDRCDEALAILRQRALK
jgi:hypothetical protein